MMKNVVKHGPTGDLAASIHKEEPGKVPTIVRVMVGGASTTRQGGGGKSYDYARAVEFGTVKMAAEPFFFPTFRLMRKTMRTSMRSKISKTIKRYSAESISWPITPHPWSSPLSAQLTKFEKDMRDAGIMAEKAVGDIEGKFSKMNPHKCRPRFSATCFPTR